MGHRLRVRMYVWRLTRSERGTRTRSLKRGKPIAGLVVPLAAGVCFDVADVWSIWHGAPGLLVARTWTRLWTHRDDPRGLVQSWTDNPTTEQHREQRRREFIWTFDTYQLIEITRGDYNWFRFTVLWFVPDCMRKQMGHTSGYKVICRTKCISIARGCGDSIERRSRAASLIRSDRFRARF